MFSSYRKIFMIIFFDKRMDELFDIFPITLPIIYMYISMLHSNVLFNELLWKYYSFLYMLKQKLLVIKVIKNVTRHIYVLQ